MSFCSVETFSFRKVDTFLAGTKSLGEFASGSYEEREFGRQPRYLGNYLGKRVE
jgi:hypothetical protein